MNLSPDVPSEPVAAPPPDRRVGQIYWLLVVTICVMVQIGQHAMLVEPCLGFAVIEAVMLLPAILYVRAKRLPLAESLGWRPISPRQALAGAILGACGLGAASVIQTLLEPMIGKGSQPDFFRADSPGCFVALLFCGAVLPGVCEETLFRGLVQQTLSRLGPIKAIVISSLLFALMHLDSRVFLPIFLLGLMLGTVAWRTGSIFTSMIAHATSNAIAFSLLYFVHDDLDRPAKIVLATLTILFAIAFPRFLARFSPPAAELGPLARVSAALTWRAIGIGLAVIVGAEALSILIAIASGLA